MATKFYLSPIAIAPIGSAALISGWSIANKQHYRKLLVEDDKDAGALTYNYYGNIASAERVLCWVAISDPLGVQTLSGTVAGGIAGRYGTNEGTNISGNLYLNCGIWVTSNDGSVVKGILLPCTRDDVALTENNVNTARLHPDSGSALTPVAIEDGDRIVIGVGLDLTVMPNKPVNLLSYLRTNSSQDISEDATVSIFSTWITFSQDLKFQSNLLVAGAVSIISESPVELVATATEAAGGEGPYEHNWEISRDDRESWTDYPGEISLDLNDNNVVGPDTFSIRMRYTDSLDNKVWSNVITVNIPAAPPLDAGIITGGAVGATAATFKQSDPSGGTEPYNYQLQQEVNSVFTNVGTYDSNLSVYTVTGLSPSTLNTFRAEISDSSLNQQVAHTPEISFTTPSGADFGILTDVDFTYGYNISTTLGAQIVQRILLSQNNIVTVTGGKINLVSGILSIVSVSSTTVEFRYDKSNNGSVSSTTVLQRTIAGLDSWQDIVEFTGVVARDTTVVPGFEYQWRVAETTNPIS